MLRPVKTYEYIIVLKEHASYKYIDWVSRLMLMIAIISFLFRAYVETQATHSFDAGGRTGLLAILSCVMIIWWIYCWGQSRHGIVPLYRFALLMAAWGWFVYDKHTIILLFVYIVAVLLEKPVKLYPEIAFDDNEIVFNSFPKKNFTWNDVNNVVLKDGLITVDLKNNQLFQREVNEPVTKETENEFNNFCKKNLNKITESTSE